MLAVEEAIDQMTPDERVRTMEYLWSAMSAQTPPEPPSWHGEVLAERRRLAESGEETFIDLSESRRRLRETAHAG